MDQTNQPPSKTDSKPANENLEGQPKQIPNQNDNVSDRKDDGAKKPPSSVIYNCNYNKILTYFQAPKDKSKQKRKSGKGFK